jgi:predicted permease
MSIRAALGATRWRLVRGLLVEGLVLALIGGALGTVLAGAGMDVIRAWLPAGLPRSTSVAMDLRVLGAAIAAAIITGIVSALAAALSASRPELTHALKQGGRSLSGGAGQRLRHILVVSEVALAVVLLVGAGLFLSSFLSVVRIDPGFDYRNVLTIDVGVRVSAGGFEAARRQGSPYVERMLEAVRTVDGVQAAGAVEGGLPFSGSWRTTPITLPGRGELTAEGDQLSTSVISPSYLEVLRIPLLTGRRLDRRDRAGAPPVILINQAAAETYWPGASPLGQRIVIDKVDMTVVGVVANIRKLGPESPPRPEGYMPLAQRDVLGATLVMRTAADPLRVLPAVKAAIWSVNTEQRLTADTVTLEGHMDRLLSQRRFNMALLVGFGALGLLIAAAGIYGVMTYIVAQRTSEIGIRMALGATQNNVMRMVLQQAGTLIGAGLAIGSAGAWYLTALVSTFLYAVEPTDGRVFAAAAVTLALAGLVASAIPARRAASVDPLVALRQE